MSEVTGVELNMIKIETLKDRNQEILWRRKAGASFRQIAYWMDMHPESVRRVCLRAGMDNEESKRAKQELYAPDSPLVKMFNKLEE
jgi:hypothetical protein